MDLFLETLTQYPVVPVFYHDDPAVCIEAVQACYDGGVRIFEFVNRGAHAEVNFRTMIAQRKSWPGMLLGVGTIKTASEAALFAKAGADFLVSPIVLAEIGETARSCNIPWVPGAMTPTEIAAAEAAGASLVKLFPGEVLGAGFVKAVRPLFPGLRFMVTGGVALEEAGIRTWFSAGVTAVGVGSQLFRTPEPGAAAAQLLGWAQTVR